MKILYITTIGATMGFFTSFIKSLLDEGHTVEIATNEKGAKVPDCYREWGYRVYQIDTSRSPLDLGNLEAIRQIKSIVEKNKYDIVHCHTPVAAMCTRLACRKARKQGTKVFYTAHGFHFYKGAPLKNWLIYYPAEWICAHWTDVLITINKEDYALAKKRMHAGKVEYVPGVGVDLEKFGGKQVDVPEKRKELGIPDGMAWILAVGELIERKNHASLIRAVANMEDVFLTIAGQGGLKDELEKLIDSLGIRDRVQLLGYRTDISELCEAADIFAFPSCQEGLPVALMEAMACGKPVVCSRIRGNTDLIDEGKGGYFFKPDKPDEIADAIREIKGSDMQKMGSYNREKVKHYDLSDMMKRSREFYELAANGGVFHLTKMIKRQKLRESIGVSRNDMLLLSVGELNENKNHAVVIKALGRLAHNSCHAVSGGANGDEIFYFHTHKNLELQYAIVGKGGLEKELRRLAEGCGVADRVHFLGFREDVADWYQAADVFVHPSKREGLPVSLMEAMAAGLPVVCSRIRGNTDLVKDGKNGFLFNPKDTEELAEKIKNVALQAGNSMKCMSWRIIREYSTENIMRRMKEMYEEVGSGGFSGHTCVQCREIHKPGRMERSRADIFQG